MKNKPTKIYTSQDFQKWGSQGGKKTGKSKVRGDSSYYQEIAKKRKKLETT